MLRGELSNRPAAICGVDYRILIETRKPYEWFIKKIPELLLHKSFENQMKKMLPLRKGAGEWLSANWEARFAAVVVGEPLLHRAIEMVLGDYLAEVYSFDDVHEFRFWMRSTPALHLVYTNDVLLLGLDGYTRPHTGWSERP